MTEHFPVQTVAQDLEELCHDLEEHLLFRGQQALRYAALCAQRMASRATTLHTSKTGSIVSGIGVKAQVDFMDVSRQAAENDNVEFFVIVVDAFSIEAATY